MDVLLVTPAFPPQSGGIGTLMYGFSTNSNQNIDVLTEKGKKRSSEHTEDLRIDDMEGIRGLYRTWRYTSKLHEEYDLIYFGHPLQSIIGAYLNADYIVNAHARELLDSPSSLKTRIESYLISSGLNSANAVIAVSQWTKERLIERGVSGNDIYQIPPGVGRAYLDYNKQTEDTKQHLSKYDIPPDAPLLLTVSRLDPRKGHDLVLESIVNIPDTHYLICGTGPLRNDLEEKARRLGIDQRVHFAGYVEKRHLPHYYSLSDVFVMPSKYIKETGNIEGFGIVFLEANAVGTPVVGTQTGGIPSAIKENETGLLVEPTVRSVSDAIQRLVDNDDLRERLGKNGKEWAQSHSWKNVSGKIDAVIESSIDNH